MGQAAKSCPHQKYRPEPSRSPSDSPHSSDSQCKTRSRRVCGSSGTLARLSHLWQRDIKASMYSLPQGPTRQRQIPSVGKQASEAVSGARGSVQPIGAVASRSHVMSVLKTDSAQFPNAPLGDLNPEGSQPWWFLEGPQSHSPLLWGLAQPRAFRAHLHSF